MWLEIKAAQPLAMKPYAKTLIVPLHFVQLSSVPLLSPTSPAMLIRSPQYCCSY